MNKPKKAKIDVTKINKTHLFRAPSGAVYLDLVIWPSDGKYGDDHMIVQDIPKEVRDAGEKGPILGNATLNVSEEAPERTTGSPPPTQNSTEDEIPF